ncbi:transglutaminase family protein [Mongoliitalea daihaiensis]|uniref:transglutaminase family protein n=1 Tax=Mongoliitalea daihaiensis TaxID=2782006 RepID=UPI001F187A7C|nr:transglutaminase family protein [Mongoliitalea daihaiensis]UJP63435.1 transglutaminase family protein [Mongoliitalea daihaiensis]
MKLNIQHTTSYTYDQAVQLSVQVINLIPQFRSYYTVDQQQITITPHPVGLHTRLDIENNLHYQAWFEGATKQFHVEVAYELTLQEINPFGFIVKPSFVFTKTGISYESKDFLFLNHYLAIDALPAAVKDFSLRMLGGADSIVTFLVNLVEKLHADWKYEVRQEEGVWPAELTFSNKFGSCRDLAWMLIQMLRSLGFAARFISGYAFNPELEEGHELHAWAEVFLPGAGWIGLDPSLGLLTDHHYVPLACSADFERAAPLIGTFGGVATSSLETFVSMTTK